jgi:hypothetical protein
MNEPKLTILGVYRPNISAETWQEQFKQTEDEAYTNGHFNKLVLIEAIVEGLNEPFQMIKFGQMDAEHPNDHRWMQVGYDEGLLSADGETLIQRDADCVHGTGTLRFAVYLHLYDPNRNLLWQHGEVSCPPIEDAPNRLMTQLPYNATD